MQAFWFIMLRLIRPGILAGGMLFAYIAVRDLSTPILLYGFGSEVLSIAMLQFWSDAEPQIVSVLAVVMLLVLTGLSGVQRWLLIERERPETVEATIGHQVTGKIVKG